METLETARSVGGASEVPNAASGYLIQVHPEERLVMLNSSGTVIGRRSTSGVADVVLDDARVSKHHVRIARQSTGFVAVDMDSKNGLRIDGRHLPSRSSARLAEASVLRIGDSLFVFRHGVPPTARREHGALPGLAPAVLEARRRVELLAREECIVLILGPTGTGKEFVARWLHEARGLPKNKLISVNCGSLQRHLARVELFGAERGAYTDAKEARAGLVAKANGGTLFLDELGELELDAQPELLRFLEDGSYRPLGKEVELTSNARVVAATHAPLDVEVQAGRFRRDLLARFKSASMPVVLPGLAERREDIMAWARMLIGDNPPRWSAGFVECLLLYDWTDNLRELRGILRTARREARDPAELRSMDLPTELVRRRDVLRGEAEGGEAATVGASASGERGGRDAPDREDVIRVLVETGGNMRRSAELLQIDRRRLYRICETWGVVPSLYRADNQPEEKDRDV